MGIPSLSLYPLPGVPEVSPGADLAGLLIEALANAGLSLEEGDVVCVAQKIVSKAEWRVVDLSTVTPSPRALELAPRVDKDPRLVELILAESRRVVAFRTGVIVVEHKSGVILANAGIDHSNVGGGDAAEQVLLLPEDANASARRLRDALRDRTGIAAGVIITDSVGRPWRLGTTGIALGAAGIPALRDLRGRTDLHGRPLRVSESADADSLAAAGCLLMGEADEGVPLVLIRGYPYRDEAQTAAALLRDEGDDLFRHGIATEHSGQTIKD
ncbi:MAG: coenzyme F420-0:L-glutamate ligase [Gammaproteobacteria bacterium]|nr:MAG: coenzyme F420-0:L-glutamate ligase [Gammaproteobacteria bacterium]